MKTFDEEYKKTSQKMSDVVLEYAAQFIAEDYLEEYRRAKRRPRAVFIPRELDDRLYQKIDKLEKREIYQRKFRLLKQTIRHIVFGAGCAAILFVIFIFSVEPIRKAIFEFVMN
ncbi:hypothetical protein [Sinanaerobacter sp. ZZT-01]|uniref:hypothetical protein n=1 Tax=Sinanaerobacter sp. ZZT-01 TaxID=3111540 RepID=UPI002D784DDF|nr:hypothetical protein [Sinanaerobacter sp. ZZT-01]WRR93575.1 hypothetical protein U5921_00170 [Sinanaerobacter sp. ZZT-01]